MALALVKGGICWSMDLSLSLPPPTDLPWDGSYLGAISKENILSELKYDGRKYIHFKSIVLDREGLPHIIETLAQIRYTNNIYVCMCDELKSLFGIEKNSTHSLRIRSQSRIAVIIKARLILIDGKPHFTTDFRAMELPINDPRCNDYLKYRVRIVLLFREVLGLVTKVPDVILIERSKSRDPLVKRGGVELVPLSINESKICARLNHNLLPSKMSIRWLSDEDPINSRFTLSEIAARLFKYDGSNLVEVISKLRSRVEEIVQRLDPEMIYIVDYIANRLKSILVAGDAENDDPIYNFDDIFESFTV